jgi:hypothetical protein
MNGQKLIDYIEKHNMKDKEVMVVVPINGWCRAYDIKDIGNEADDNTVFISIENIIYKNEEI